MRKYKNLMLLFIAFILISGCSKDTNKANINEKMFEDGKQVVKEYSKVNNGGDDEKAGALMSSFLQKYEKSSYSSENEEYFVKSLKLLDLEYRNYFINKANGDEQASSEAKNEMKNTLLKIKNAFGILLDA